MTDIKSTIAAEEKTKQGGMPKYPAPAEIEGLNKAEAEADTPVETKDGTKTIDPTFKP